MFKQDCSYQGETLNVPTAFKVYGAAVITIQQEIYRQFGQRQFSQFYKTLDSKEKQDCSYQGEVITLKN